MKFIYGLFVGCAFTVVATVLVASLIEKPNADEAEARWAKRHDKQHAYSVLDSHAHPQERIIKAERNFAALYLDEDKIEPYMDFFIRGLNSSGASIMVEGGRNQHLELAHRRGFEMKQIFADGYRIAVRENQ